MLGHMHSNRLHFRNACSNAVRSFDILRPDTTKPDTPVLELCSLCFITAVIDHDTVLVAKQDHITCWLHKTVQMIELRSCAIDKSRCGILETTKFPFGQNP